MSSVRIKSVVRNVVEKSDGSPEPFLGLEDLASGTGRLLVNELPLKAAEDSIRHKSGDVLFSKLRPYLAKSHLPQVPGTGTAELLVLRPGGLIDAKFLLYVTLSQPWVEWANTTAYGTKMPRTSWELIGDYRTWLPPLEEQRRIAGFLDIETARIDQLAAAREVQISALEERELAVIADMLSGGATSNDGRATGWPWLPNIPPAWSIGPVYAYFSTELGKMLNADRASGMNQRPYLRNANVHWYEIDTSDMAAMSFEADEVNRYSVSPGDLLVCEGGAGVAEAAVWDGRIEECYFQKSLHRIRKSSALPVEWLMYWLRFAKSCGVFDAGGNLATIPHLTGEQLRQYRIPIPTEGQELVRNTGRSIDYMAKVRRTLGQAQSLFAERRQALITAAVTDQFDVSAASGRGVDSA
ncbi:hypothetical protein OHA33_34000 [Streptomyces sp. NBC_00562]|uniref:hypothetical protein n=1 Tax=Streptomyces sp. NBC_00562 TaxID=2975777 RepID=UPI002E81B37D|nr:hypothetical protein [Streptomyces sp. NBC_00562]WUC23471.1 hypothetical protein OHA33_34000 [Streptomyces sp. NBC_00562]